MAVLEQFKEKKEFCAEMAERLEQALNDGTVSDCSELRARLKAFKYIADCTNEELIEFFDTGIFTAFFGAYVKKVLKANNTLNDDQRDRIELDLEIELADIPVFYEANLGNE